jgi:hypothetical protein
MQRVGVYPYFWLTLIARISQGETMADLILNQVSVNHMFDLRGVVAVVTGGGTVSFRVCSTPYKVNIVSQGIGLMITTTLISNGATVFIIGPTQRDLDRYITQMTLVYSLLNTSLST